MKQLRLRLGETAGLAARHNPDWDTIDLRLAAHERLWREERARAELEVEQSVLARAAVTEARAQLETLLKKGESGLLNAPLASHYLRIATECLSTDYRRALDNAAHVKRVVGNALALAQRLSQGEGELGGTPINQEPAQHRSAKPTVQDDDLPESLRHLARRRVVANLTAQLAENEVERAAGTSEEEATLIQVPQEAHRAASTSEEEATLVLVLQEEHCTATAERATEAALFRGNGGPAASVEQCEPPQALTAQQPAKQSEEQDEKLELYEHADHALSELIQAVSSADIALERRLDGHEILSIARYYLSLAAKCKIRAQRVQLVLAGWTATERIRNIPTAANSSHPICLEELLEKMANHDAHHSTDDRQSVSRARWYLTLAVEVGEDPCQQDLLQAAMQQLSA